MSQRILLLISLCILTGCAVIPQTQEGQKPREASPEEIEWQTSFKSAVNIANARKMPMMLVFYGVSSRRLDQNAFSDPDVIELAQQFVCLKIGAVQVSPECSF